MPNSMPKWWPKGRQGVENGAKTGPKNMETSMQQSMPKTNRKNNEQTWKMEAPNLENHCFPAYFLRNPLFLYFLKKSLKNSIEKGTKIEPKSLDSMTCLTLAPEVGKINPRRLDFVTFWPWLQKSLKSISEVQIWWLSGLGSRSQQNQSLKS